MILTTQKGFKGIDQRANFGDNLNVAEEMLNFRITESGSVARRQGVNYICTMDSDINGIWQGDIKNERMVVFACGGKLYKISQRRINVTPIYLGDIGGGDCIMFEFGGCLYIKTTDYYGKFDGETVTEVEGYVPLVAIGCTPQGEGESFEEINLICPKRRQQFSSNGSSLIYYLAEKDIESVESIKIDGADYTGKWVCSKADGTISLESAIAAGLNNVEITYKKADSGSRSRILSCTKAMNFGGNSDSRIFLWGNTDYPNYRFYSETANGVPSAEYFPVNAFTVIGNSRITCITQQYDKQLIFTDNAAYYSYCELKTDSLGNTVCSFPVYNLNGGKGCIFETEGCIIENKPVTLCPDGLNMWEATGVESEKNAVCFSQPIYKHMRAIATGDESHMKMFDFQANHELYFIYGDNAYIYNYGNGAWYIYTAFGGKHFCVCGDLLYFAKGGDLCLFGNDVTCPIEEQSVWVSPCINGGCNADCHIVRFDADLHVHSNSNIRFEFAISENKHKTVQELVFPEGTDKFIRVAMRPRWRRSLPFRIVFTDMGSGQTVLHGMILKTKNNERKRRNGIL